MTQADSPRTPKRFEFVGVAEQDSPCNDISNWREEPDGKWMLADDVLEYLKLVGAPKPDAQ